MVNIFFSSNRLFDFQLVPQAFVTFNRSDFVNITTRKPMAGVAATSSLKSYVV